MAEIDVAKGAHERCQPAASPLCAGLEKVVVVGKGEDQGDVYVA